MKIVRYESNGRPIIAQIGGNRILPLSDIDDLPALIARWETDATLSSVQSRGPGFELAGASLLAPVVATRNVFCVGWNYLKHFDESTSKRAGQGVELPQHPTFFTKLPTTVAPPHAAVPLHETHTAQLDWEVELAVIIGKRGRDIPEADALDYVFGYTIANDITARDLQRAHGGQWFKGKSLDSTCPLGPVIVTADEIADPQNLELSFHLNGQSMQQGHTRNQIFTVARIIAELSVGLTLLPGDVILTGTPEGIGAARVPPVFLKDGDIMECNISGIGLLRNVVRAGLEVSPLLGTIPANT
ncbi:hypothetical protein AGMMS50225_07290 [Betaproteobacteria bacterium]|nr:hypothetical protein AGMMS50225_07290 [Betaproteobacteria bacterium]